MRHVSGLQPHTAQASLRAAPRQEGTRVVPTRRPSDLPGAAPDHAGCGAPVWQPDLTRSAKRKGRWSLCERPTALSPRVLGTWDGPGSSWKSRDAQSGAARGSWASRLQGGRGSWRVSRLDLCSSLGAGAPDPHLVQAVPPSTQVSRGCSRQSPGHGLGMGTAATGLPPRIWRASGSGVHLWPLDGEGGRG